MLKNSLVALFVFALFVFAYTPVTSLVSVVTDADGIADRAMQHQAHGFAGC